MKNKKLLILLIIIFFIMLFSSSVYSYSEQFEYNSIKYEFYIPNGGYEAFLEMEEYKSGNYNYLLSCDNRRIHIYFWLKEYDVKIYQTDKFNYYNSNIEEYSCIEYSVDENRWNSKINNRKL